MAEDGITTADLEEDGASVIELDSSALSRCSTYSYNPADFPRACEIEEFMSPSFQWPASPAPSFASLPPFSGVVNAKTKRPDQPSGSASAFRAPKTKFAWWRGKKSPSVPYPFKNPAPAHLVRFTQKELRAATGGFRDPILFSKVYKGRLSDGSLVAVKRLNRHDEDNKFKAVIISSCSFPHRNILRLIGFCVDATEMFLVCSYMANGNVSDWLRPASKHPPLDWATRIRVAIGTAKALTHLHDHCNPKIIHRDVNPQNIFLDGSFEPLLGGFHGALSMDPEKTAVIDSVYGTMGYLAPEYASQRTITDKLDVFAYGITLLELITGKPSVSLMEEHVLLLHWVKDNYSEGESATRFVDPKIQDNNTEAEKLIQIALLCTQESPNNRPKMSEVLMMLEVGVPPEKWQKLKITQKMTGWTSSNSMDSLQNFELPSPR